MAHSLNLAAKCFLEALAPTPPRTLAKAKRSRTTKPAADVDQDDEIEGGREEEEDGEADESKIVDFQPGDLLGKARAFVSQARLHFDGSCHGVSDNNHS